MTKTNAGFMEIQNVQPPWKTRPFSQSVSSLPPPVLSAADYSKSTASGNRQTDGGIISSELTLTRGRWDSKWRNLSFSLSKIQKHQFIHVADKHPDIDFIVHSAMIQIYFAKIVVLIGECFPKVISSPSAVFCYWNTAGLSVWMQIREYRHNLQPNSQTYWLSCVCWNSMYSFVVYFVDVSDHGQIVGGRIFSSNSVS